MTCRDYKEMMMAYLDNELDDTERRAFEKHLEQCELCRAELNEFKELKKLTDNVKLIEPEDKVWAQYWGQIYNRIERGIGWILLSVAGMILLFYGGFKMIECIIKDPAVEMIFKIALILLIAGLSILLVSVLRESLYFRNKDRYKDIRR